MRVWTLTAALLMTAGLLLAPPSDAADAKSPVEIKEWKVPYGGRSRDPDAQTADTVWFVGQSGGYLAKLDVKTGKFTRHIIDDRAGPHNVIVADNGIVWYSGNLQGYIGRYDPRTDKIERIAMPNSDADDPHTLIFDKDQTHIWFTVQGGNFVGRLTIATRKVDLIPVPTSGSRPYGIIMAPNGTAWVALFGTNKLAAIDPKTFKLTEHKLPNGARPRRVDVTTDGRLYYVDYRRGFLGRLDPKSSKIDEWPMPSGSRARPYGMAVDSKGRIWFVETGPSDNLFIGFDPKTESYFSVTPIPSGAGSVRHMNYHAPSGTVWFGTDENTIGRAKVNP